MPSAFTLDLPSADDLFSTQEEREEDKREKVRDIPLGEIDGFEGHTFHVNDDEAMDLMVASIKEYGVLNPAIVRQKNDGRFEIISGHRRKRACEIIGLRTMPVIVRQMERDEAVISMVDSNLQRENILPSEKAFSYKLKMEALSHQGKRTDLACSPMENKSQEKKDSNLTCSPVENKSPEKKTVTSTCSPVENKSPGKKTADIVGEIAGDSRATVYRYISLTNLIPELLDMVDCGKIAFRPAVEISFLPKEKQEALCAAMEAECHTPSLAQAQRIRRFEERGKLNREIIQSTLAEEKPNQTPQVKIPHGRIARFFPDSYTPKQMEDTIIKLLEKWQRQKENSRNER